MFSLSRQMRRQVFKRHKRVAYRAFSPVDENRASPIEEDIAGIDVDVYQCVGYLEIQHAEASVFEGGSQIAKLRLVEGRRLC